MTLSKVFKKLKFIVAMEKLFIFFDMIKEIINKFQPNEVLFKETLYLFEAMLNESNVQLKPNVVYCCCCYFV